MDCKNLLLVEELIFNTKKILEYGGNYCGYRYKSASGN